MRKKLRKRKSNRPPKSEPSVRRLNRERTLAQVQPLLYSRQTTARRLGRSVATIIRMERAGILSTVRLGASATSQVLHHAAQVDALGGKN
jgi:hypothetical protein